MFGQPLQRPGGGWLAAQQRLQGRSICHVLHGRGLRREVADHMAHKVVGQPSGDLRRIAALGAAGLDAFLDGGGIDHIARLVGAGVGIAVAGCGGDGGGSLVHQSFHQGLLPDAGACG